MVTAVLLTVIAAFNTVAMPSVNGWAICTPQNGIVLAFLLMTRRKLWPWIVLGYAVALSQGEKAIPTGPHFTAFEILGNLAEVGIAAFTLPPFRNLKQWLQERRLLPAFLFYAMVLGPLLMALTVARQTPGTVGSVAASSLNFWARVRVVVLAEAIGIALATSLVLVLLNSETYKLFRLRALPQTLALFAISGSSTWLVFQAGSTPLLLLIPVSVLVIIAFRLGLRAAVLATALSTVAVAIWTLQFHGPAAAPQTYFALAVLVILPLSVTLAGKHYVEDRLADAHGELDKLKSLDRLTGVPNRKRFDLVLEREWQRATRDPKPVALLMVDVDDFDLFNQHYGPQAGDECLRLVAARMTTQPHRAYDLISRYDGGRFTVLLPGASGEAVERIAEEFRAEIAAQEWPHELSPFERITVSIGWAAMVPSEHSRPDALIAAADSALRLARENGKNRVEGVNANLTAPA
jgi:diguanylate cyclase (GGDEF)-like protein